MAQLATPRFVFDEDLQGVGLLIRKARSDFGDVWVIGHPPCPIAKETDDEKWIPVVATQRAVIIRNDKDLLNPETESYRAWRATGARGFHLSIAQSKSSLWDQTKALIRQWDRIEKHAADHETDKWWIGKITAGSVGPA